MSKSSIRKDVGPVLVLSSRISSPSVAGDNEVYIQIYTCGDMGFDIKGRVFNILLFTVHCIAIRHCFHS